MEERPALFQTVVGSYLHLPFLFICSPHDEEVTVFLSITCRPLTTE